MTAIALALVVLTYAYAVTPTSSYAKPVTNFSGTGTGTMTVTIFGRAPDGGFNIQAQDLWWNAVRPRPMVQCEVYRDGSIICGRDDVLSTAQLALLPLLEQIFDPGTIRTAHYSIPEAVPNNAVAALFDTISPVPNSGGSPNDSGYTGYAVCIVDTTVVYTTPRAHDAATLTIDADGNSIIPCRATRTLHDRTTITYDPARQLPVFVHSVQTGTSASVFGSISVDLKLLSAK
ncbi:MAG TPA: hypothetical protein VGG89_04515 [Candidatus Baltobacteraceae bacterium]|jgi:hypothetical protein